MGKSELLQSQLSSLKGELKTLKQRKRDLQAVLSEAQQLSGDLTDSNSRLDAMSSDVAHAIKGANIETISMDIDSRKANAAALNDVLDFIEVEISRVDTEISVKDVEISNKKQAVDAAKAEEEQEKLAENQQ